jgi:hypothetical protein
MGSSAGLAVCEKSRPHREVERQIKYKFNLIFTNFITMEQTLFAYPTNFTCFNAKKI